MPAQTFSRYAQAVAHYLAIEWPAASLAIASSQDANRAAIRASLACFIACASTPHAAGDVAQAVATVVKTS